MRLVHEFREFALKGNVMDMAVGVIVGGAFGGIVKSLIDDVFMPIVGIAGKADFSNLYVALTPTVHEKIARVAAASAEGSFPSLEEARKLGPVLAYGSFLTVVVNFTILAGIVFLMVKGINTAKKALEKQEQSGPPSPPRPEVQLLTEIRDLLQTPKVSPAATAVAASPAPPTETATAEPEPPRSAIQIRRPSWFRSRA